MLQDSGDSLYYEGRQLRLKVQEGVEQILTQLRGAAALHARAQERMQKSTETSGQTAADIAAETLPLMRHLTGEGLLACVQVCSVVVLWSVDS